jgi:hypothetical protein
MRQRCCILIRRVILERVLKVQCVVAIWVAVHTNRSLRVPPKSNEGFLLETQHGIPFDKDSWPLEEGVNDCTVVPVGHRLIFLVEMLGYMIASFGPIVAEVVTKTTTPTRSRVPRSSGLLDVLPFVTFSICMARITLVPFDMMSDEVLVQEIFGIAKVALKLFWAFLVGLLMSLPVGLSYESLGANGTEVLLDCIRASGSLLARRASLVIIFVWCRGPWWCAPLWRLKAGALEWTWGMRRMRRRMAA